MRRWNTSSLGAGRESCTSLELAEALQIFDDETLVGPKETVWRLGAPLGGGTFGTKSIPSSALPQKQE